MSSNPYLDAINFKVPTQNSQDFDSQSFIQNILSNMHGANLAPMQKPWQTSPDFINSMSGNPSGAPNVSMPSALRGQSASSAPSSGGSFWDKLKAAASDAWNNTIGKEYSQAKGFMRGFPTMLSDNEGNFTGGKFDLPTALKAVTSPLYGYTNPAQEESKYQAVQSEIAQMPMPKQAHNELWALNAAMDTATDPLTYAPLGPVAKVAGKATGIPKLLEALKQSAPTAARVPLNAATSVFKPVGGARPEFLNALSRYTGTVQSGNNEAMRTVKDLLKGTTPESRANILHGYESTVGPMPNAREEGLRNNIGTLLQNTLDKAKSKGLINSEIDPQAMGVARYIPHVNVSKLDESANPFSDITRRNPNVDAGKTRGLAGTVQGINNASAKKVFEDDLAKVLTYHFGQINKASATRDLIDEAMQHGLPMDGSVKAGEQFPGTFQKAVEYASPHSDESVLLPESEARYLQQLKAPQSEAKQFGKAMYRGGVNALNRLMFITSPFVHIANNLGTQTLLHAPGAFLKMPKYVSSMWKGVEPGSKMDEALKSGALHLSSVMHGASTPKNMAKQVVKDLAPKAPLPLRIPKMIAKGYNELTPRGEQVYRAAAYEHALEKGMNPEQAANWIRSIYGGRIAGDAASPAENAVASFMPFINWTKTAIGSNVKNAVNRPGAYLAGYNALNEYNKQETGHGMGDNPNPLSIGLPWKDAQGNPEYWAPYAPPFDVAKLVKEIADNGPRGVPIFGFNRSNPFVKFGLQAATGEQNPFANPGDKFNVSPSPLLPSSLNKRGAFFGDKGPQLPAYLGQLLQDISNPLSVGTDVQDKGLRDTLLTQLLGGYINAPNPASKQKQEQYQQRQTLSQYKSYLKKHPGGK